jgi:hypothetical protein
LNSAVCIAGAYEFQSISISNVNAGVTISSDSFMYSGGGPGDGGGGGNGTPTPQPLVEPGGGGDGGDGGCEEYHFVSDEYYNSDPAYPNIVDFNHEHLLLSDASISWEAVSFADDGTLSAVRNTETINSSSIPTGVWTKTGGRTSCWRCS